MSAPTEQDWPNDLIAFKWASTLSEGEQSVLLTRNIKVLQDAILAALQAERERTRAETRAETWKDAIAALMQAEKEDARLAAAQLPQGETK